MGKYCEGEVLQGVFALLYQKGRRENMGERERKKERKRLPSSINSGAV